MYSQVVKYLQTASPVDIEKCTGIKNWASKSQSYTKSLINNTLLPYDKSSFYCLDKLHLSYKYLNNKKRNELKSIFWSKQQKEINRFVILIPENRKPSYYYYSFSVVVVEEQYFGRLYFFHTTDLDNCLIEVDNEILYCQSTSWIIAGIYTVAKTFSLQFNNISIVEIARDSNDNLPKKFAEVYYRSVHCCDIVHEINGDHRFYKFVTKCSLAHLPDDDDTSEGIFRVGKPTSNTFIKGYNKTKEIADNGEKKRYIKHIHNNHLNALNMRVADNFRQGQ